MSKQALIKILLGEFYDKLGRLNDLVPRDATFPVAPDKIKVATGIRRVGKTYFIYQQILTLIKEGVATSSILYINFEDDRLLPLDQHKLASLVDMFYAVYPENHERKCYLFFDEIQNIQDWPLVIRRLHDSKNVEIFLTGSSAKLLSKEIATSLRGRSLTTEIWPYSFSEFMRAKKIEFQSSLYDKKAQDKLTQYFNFYLTEGGFPEITSLSPDIRQKVLQEYVDIVIYRDIIERHNVKNPSVIKYMIISMIANIGKPFSINKFYNDIKSQGYAIGKDILYEYAAYIEDTYLAFSVSLYHPSVRKVQTMPKKLYAIDAGLMRAVTLSYESDFGRLFENIVYLDLKRLGYEISYYVTNKGNEVDFLVQSARGHKQLVQVTWNMDDENTRKREEKALEEGMKELNIDGEIITLDTYLEKTTKVFSMLTL